MGSIASAASGAPTKYQQACGRASQTTSSDSTPARNRAWWNVEAALGTGSRVPVMHELGGNP
jgi:hypothetical protein